MSPLATDGLRFSHQLDVGVGRRRESQQVCSALLPPPQPPILIDGQEEQEWAEWGHLPGGTGTSSFILRHGGESQLHPQANSFFPHVFSEQSRKRGTVAVQEEAGFSSNLHPPRFLVPC